MIPGSEHDYSTMAEGKFEGIAIGAENLRHFVGEVYG